MTHVGIDLEQFTTDPYGSGIQRVLQQLAANWPDEVGADFVVPFEGAHGLLTAQQAHAVVSLAFAHASGSDGDAVRSVDLRESIAEQVRDFDPIRVKDGDLLAIFDAWLLPEVSYLPSVLNRFELMQRCLPTAMIGYDALPMTEPGNYRFRPGSAGDVSRYFRLLAGADAVVCISAHARSEILGRLRRSPALPIGVSHPGGDHVSRVEPEAGSLRAAASRPRFLRLGTLEARKRPREILSAFRLASAAGLEAELVFVGDGSASDESINADVSRAVSEGIGVTWIRGAGDEQVHELITTAHAFLSIGIEGYGIPVLESLRLGTPVLFDGIQPAAELMEGAGARRIAAGGARVDEEALAAELLSLTPEVLAQLSDGIDADRVPRWRDFALGVVDAVVG